MMADDEQLLILVTVSIAMNMILGSLLMWDYLLLR